MSAENDFLPFAVGVDANVLTQSAYAALTSLTQNGFSAGIAPSIQLNKVWRQSSIMAAVMASFIVAQTGQTAIDDGTTATLLTNFTAAVVAASKQRVILTDTGSANAYAAANAVPLTVLPTISGVVQTIQIAHTNTATSTYAPDGLAAKPIFGLGALALQGGEVVTGGIATLVSYVGPLLNSGTLCWVLYECIGGAQQVAPATQSEHAVQLGQTGGRFFGTQVVTSSTTVTPGTYVVDGVPLTARFWRCRGTAPGGAGGGAVATGASQVAAGGGGAAGSPFEFLLSPAVATAVTMGAPGAGAVGANGGNGGNLVIGSIATITGGQGGAVGNLQTAGNGLSGSGGSAQNSTIAGTGVQTVFNGYGQAGTPGYGITTGQVLSGTGGQSMYGSAPQLGNAGSALGFGVGGLGAAHGSSVAASAGTSGAPGVLYIDEYY